MRIRRETRGRFGQDCLGAALLLVAVAALGGCGQPPVPPPVVTCAVTDRDIGQWIENPSMPLEPAGSEYSCFYNFAWQELFAVTQPEGGVPRFATWPNDQELFPASGDAKPWRTGLRPMLGRQIRKGHGLPGMHGVIADQFKEAAALTPFTDQFRRWVHYSVLVNRPEYDYIRCCELYRGDCFNSMAGVSPVPPPIQPSHPPASPPGIDLPDGSVELKLAWRVLETCDLPDSKRPCTKEDASKYLTVRGEVEFFSPEDPSRPVKTFPATLGLVGMHIVHWTKQYPGAIWATFEHVDNAPNCASGPDGPIDAPPQGFPGWAFYNAQCNHGSPYCQDNQFCPACPVQVPPAVVKAFNQANPPPAWQIPADGVITCTPVPNELNQAGIQLLNPQCTKPPIPTQTCRSTPIGTDVEGLNDQVQKVLVGLKGLPGLTAVLANYELVGAEWFANAVEDKKNQPQGSPAVNNQVMLSNTTLETYLQAIPPGCVLCHANQGAADGSVSPVPPAPPMLYNSALADRSFVFQQIRQFGAACSKDQPAKCSAWKEECLAEK
jgi:hypothetical protein